MAFLRDAVSLTEIVRSYYTPRSTQRAACVEYNFRVSFSYIDRECMRNYDDPDASNGVHVPTGRWDPSSISCPLCLRSISSSSVLLALALGELRKSDTRNPSNGCCRREIRYTRREESAHETEISWARACLCVRIHGIFVHKKEMFARALRYRECLSLCSSQALPRIRWISFQAARHL